MGIDIYLYWDNMAPEDREAQYTGFSTVSGYVGYLREAYHGDPYATRVLMPEAFEWEPGEDFDPDADDAVWGVEIPASTMADRIEHVAKVVEERERTIYNETDPDSIKQVVKAFVDFVELAKQKEAEQGHPCRVYASY